MKTILQFIIVVLFTVYCGNVSAQSFNYLGTYNQQGLPNYLTSPDTIQADFLQRIKNSIPEQYPVPQYNPSYLLDTVGTDIRIQDSVDLWITFVDEGAGYLNSLAFYTYQGSNPSMPKSLTVLFPNISLVNSGGALQPGFKIKLGRFAGGTNVGFALMADGFKNGRVTSGNNIFYTTDKFNPESDPKLKRHAILLRDKNGTIVLGFEDLRRDQGADNDFNDVVFYITASDKSRIFTDNVNGTVGTGKISSGNLGGLESNGSLAEAIALRNFKRSKAPSVDYNNTDKLERFKEVKQGQVETRSDIEMEQFIPEQPFFEPTSAYVTTPKDLLLITNAQKVLSVDYFDDVTNERRGVVLTSKTENKVYDHTKITCDRLIGSNLEKAEIITIEGLPFIRSVLSRADGTFEYAISFSVYKIDATSAGIISRWAVEDYPTKNEFWNFQVWSEAPHLSQKLVEEILFKIKNQYPNLKSEQAPQLPKVFVQKGEYDNGILSLTVFNPFKAKTLVIKGNIGATETTKRSNFIQQVTLNGIEEENVRVNVGTVYDMGFAVLNEKSAQADILYFADGVWGLDYDQKSEKIEYFEVKNPIPTIEKDIYTVERDVQLRGSVMNYVSLFRSLRPAGEPIDLSAYKNLSFTAAGSGIVEITLIKKSITDWTKQYRTEVKLYEDKQNYQIALSDFTNGANESIKADDLLSVVYTFKGNGQEAQSFEFIVENIAFNNKVSKSAPLTTNLMIAPNPAAEEATISFKMEERGTASVSVINLQGQAFYQVTETFVKGRNDLKINVTNLPKGVYLVNITTAKERFAKRLTIF